MPIARGHHLKRAGAAPEFLPLTPVEACLIVAAAFLYWNDALRQIFPGIESTSIEFRAVHFIFYGLFCLGLLNIGTPVLDALTRTPLLVAVLALPIVSTLWSIAPQETVQRSIAVIGSSLLGVYLACRLSPLDACRLIGKAATLSAVLSLFLIFFVPSVGLMSEGEYVNVWGGAHLHKNGLGQMTALGSIICLIVLIADGLRRNYILAVGLGLNLLLLAGSRSLTSQLAFVAAVVLLFTMGRFIRFMLDNAIVTGPTLFGAIAIALFALSTEGFVDILASFGKDATMSSRLPLWQLLGGFMEGHWWLGHGYEAFWTDESFAVRVIQKKLHFRPYYSHNGYLEIWLAFGTLGLALVAALIASLVARTMRGLYRHPTDPLLLVSFVYVLMFLLQNSAEATVLQRNNMSWTLGVMLYVAVSNVARERAAWSPSGRSRHRTSIAANVEQPVRRLPVT